MEKLKSEQGASLLSAPIIYISLPRNSRINANTKILAAPAPPHPRLRLNAPREQLGFARRAGHALDPPRGGAPVPPRGFCGGRTGAEPRSSSEAPAGGFCRPARSAENDISHLLFFLAGIPPHFGREAKKKIPAPIKKNVAGTLLIAILWRVGVAKPPVLAEPEKSRNPIMETVESPRPDATMPSGTEADLNQNNRTGNIDAVISIGETQSENEGLPRRALFVRQNVAPHGARLREFFAAALLGKANLRRDLFLNFRREFSATENNAIGEFAGRLVGE